VPGGHSDHAFGTGPVDYNTIEEIERLGEVLRRIASTSDVHFINTNGFFKDENAGIVQ
jgi:hypothetical protein